MITITSRDYTGKRKQWVANITGRDKKFMFSREFVGQRVGEDGCTMQADIDEDGLYESCSIGNKGKEYTYHIVVTFNGEQKLYDCCKKDAMLVARHLDKRPFELVVRGADSGPWVFIGTQESVKLRVSATVFKAVEACWTVMQPLPPKEVRKVLAELRKRAFPPATPPVSPDPAMSQPVAGQ